MKPLLILLLLTFASCSMNPCKSLKGDKSEANKRNLCCPEPGHGDFCPICGVAIPTDNR